MKPVFKLTVIAFILLTAFASCKKNEIHPTPMSNIGVTLLPPTLPESLQSIFFLNDKDGYVSGFNGGIYKTTDAGQSWTTQHSGVSLPVYGLWFLNASKGFAVGGDDGCSGNGCTIPGSFVLQTLNGGQTWTKIYTPSTKIELTSICFTSATTGYCVGNDRVIKTTDGGQTWTEYALAGMASKLWKVKFINQQRGLIVTTSSQLVSTNDAGATWQVSSSPFNQNYFDLGAINGTLYLASQTKLSKSTDNGLNWIVLPNAPTNIYTTHFIDADHRIGLGSGTYSGGDFGHFYGAIYTTSDGGNSWTGLEFQNLISIYMAHFPTANVGYGLNGTKVVKIVLP